MKEDDNLIEDDQEPKINNSPIVVNELETNLLQIQTKEELESQLGNGCRMNKEVASTTKELSYKCPVCVNRMKNICLYCIQSCHRNHIKGSPPDIFKNDMINFQDTPCDCAKCDHRVQTLTVKKTIMKPGVSGEKEEEIETESFCPFNQLFSCIKPKYVYRRKRTGKIYCLFCINNYIPTEEDKRASEEEEEANNEQRKSVNSVNSVTSSEKESRKSFLSIIKDSVDRISEELDPNSQKENVAKDDNFYSKYEKVEVDYSKPFPNCECQEKNHKHNIPSENIDNLYNYMMNIVDRNKLNLDKLAYHIFNDTTFHEVLFTKFFHIQDYIFDKLQDIEIVEASSLKRKIGNEDTILTNIEFDDVADWEEYHKAVKLFDLASRRLKILNFFSVGWLNDKIKKYFSCKTVSKLLLCKSIPKPNCTDFQDQLFKVQLFCVKIYRRAFLTGIPSVLLVNENTSFINRQIYNAPASKMTNQTFDEGEKIADYIFYLLELFSDNQKIDPKDYNELFVEALKIIKAIVAYKTNDVGAIMSLFRKIEDNISNVKEKKNDIHRKIVKNLEDLIEKIFSYFNDNKFLTNVRSPGKETSFQYAFKGSEESEYNKEIISTLFNFDLEVSETTPYIESDNFYDILVNEKDSYAESIENFLNASNEWKTKVNKDFTDLLHGRLACPAMDDVSEFFTSITMNLKGLLTNQSDEKQFLTTSCQLIKKLANNIQSHEDTSIVFAKQVNFVQHKYYFKTLFLIAIEQRIFKFALNSEKEGSEENKAIKQLTNDIKKYFRNLFILITKQNPLTSSILFNKIAISLLLQDTEDLLLYYELLKVMRDHECKINTSFLTKHIQSTYFYCLDLNKREGWDNVIALLKVYELILNISSEKSILEANNIIAVDLKYILENSSFERTLDNLGDDIEGDDFIEKVFNCIHCLQNEYFYIINPYINIKKITIKLKDETISPRMRLVLTKIHTDYFVKNYFSMITINKFFESENLITANLVENLEGGSKQDEFIGYVRKLSNIATSNKNVTNLNNLNTRVLESEEKMQIILYTIFDNLQKYRYFHNKFIEIFNKDFSLTLEYFKHVILYPSLYGIYKLTYFPKKYTSPQKYDLYKLVFLYLQCYQFFLNEVIPKFTLENQATLEIWSKFVVKKSNIEEMKKKVNESVTTLGEKSGKVLDMKILFHNFIENSKDFKEIRDQFLENEEKPKDDEEEEEEKEENEEEDDEFLLSYYSLSQKTNLFKRLRKEFNNYMKMKSEFEGNNVFDDIFQDEQLDLVQQEIAFDLLHKLSFKKKSLEFKKQENIGYIFQSTLTRGKEDIKQVKPQNPWVTMRRKGLFNKSQTGVAGINAISSDRTEKYGEYYNPYLSNFIESKSPYLEIVDKCFKSNPSFWQEQVVEKVNICRDLIYIFITNQLPFLVQFIFMEFNKIDTKESKYYTNFINILEFLRLLCEDHNPLFQTMLINYEKAIGKVEFEVTHNSKNVFIPFITKIPIFVLLNIKHYLSKEDILQGFIKKDTNYFNPLIEKITDFLIEIIQGTYPDNFKDITTSIDEISRSGLEDYIKKHYQFLDYLDANSSYEPIMNHFFRFFNSFIEENANDLSIKLKFMNIFHPKKLINVSINEFKRCVQNNIDENITEECSEKLTTLYITDYDRILDDYSFSLSLTIFLYFKRANSFKDKSLGDKYQQILDSLKELYDANEDLEENSNLLLRREYYQFCSNMIKETQISFTEDKSREKKEILKYKNFFSGPFMREIIESRNENCKKSQNLVNVFLLVHPDSLYFKETDTQQFLEKASYNNFNEKLTCIIDYYPEINQIIEMRKTFKSSKTLLRLCQINYNEVEKYNAIFSIITNVCLAFRKPGDNLDKLMIIFAFIHIALLSLLILNWYVFNVIKEIKNPSNTSMIKVIFLSIFNAEIIPFTWTLTFGLLGVSDELLRFFFSFQLFPIFFLFDTMKSVIEAVKVRYNQFLSTGFLLVILVLFYSALTFYFFKIDNNGNQLCTTYLHCFMYLFNYGIRAGGVPFEIKIYGQEGFWGEFIYNWVFYFIVILIILNIVNGIIVDKFQDLRETNNQIEEEKQNVCYICSLKRSKFEIKGISFENHVNNEHNISNYFHYLMKIMRTDEHDLNSTDFQVYNAFKQRKIEFFPIKDALSLSASSS